MCKFRTGCDGTGSENVVTSAHLHGDAGPVTFGNGIADAPTVWVFISKSYLGQGHYSQPGNKHFTSIVG
jgi:hypothetical protein